MTEVGIQVGLGSSEEDSVPPIAGAGRLGGADRMSERRSAGPYPAG